MNLDIDRLRADLIATSRSLRDWKNTWRQPNRTPTPDEWHRMHAMKTKATLLCTMRAHSRGRIHRLPPRDMLLAWQQKTIGAEAFEAYAIREEEPAQKAG